MFLIWLVLLLETFSCGVLLQTMFVFEKLSETVVYHPIVQGKQNKEKEKCLSYL